ncbi:S8 family peptidase [Bacillus sp. FJAT-47783]|uniref:S8 family peptidase n=1 Tax=Bacillus sp. FJAT-47783 TaxID=2922712 RepID=UPI001FAC0F25|nr:S8 family peptidase [Bacillus sp. FJAT-47783]
MKYESKIYLGYNKIISEYELPSDVPKNLDFIGARKIWDKTQGEGNIIAVIDSGVDKTHPALKNSIFDGYNFTNDDNGKPNIYNDYNGHGTHVAGIISSNNSKQGIMGIAPKSKLLILKVIDKQGSGNYNCLINAINYAINWEGPKGEKVNVINMSLGGTEPNEELHKVIKEARSRGIVLIAAAGNNGDGDSKTFEIVYPGFYEEVIQVGSIKKNGSPSSFSNTNVNLDFVAPGENIMSTHLNGKYVKLSGTSMAAPFVSGAVALILNIIDRSNPKLVPYLVYQYLLDNARYLDHSIYHVGNGLIQLPSG